MMRKSQIYTDSIYVKVTEFSNQNRVTEALQDDHDCQSVNLEIELSEAPEGNQDCQSTRN